MRELRLALSVKDFEALIRGDVIEKIVDSYIADRHSDRLQVHVNVLLDEVNFAEMLETVRRVANDWFRADAERTARARGEDTWDVKVGEAPDVVRFKETGLEMRKLLQVEQMLARIEKQLGMNLGAAHDEEASRSRVNPSVWHCCLQCGKVLTGLERRRNHCPECLANKKGAPDI